MVRVGAAASVVLAPCCMAVVVVVVGRDLLAQPVVVAVLVMR
jgi:hypothetical protein